MRPAVLFNVAVFAVTGRRSGFNRLTAVNRRLDCVRNLFAVCTFNSDFFRLGKVEFVAFFVRNRNTCDTYVKLNIRSICALGERNADFLRTLVDCSFCAVNVCNGYFVNRACLARVADCAVGTRFPPSSLT